MIDRALLDAVREEWLEIGLSTAPADRDAAERGIRMAYEALRLPPPRVILWLDSLAAGWAAASLLSADQVKPLSRSTVGEAVWKQIATQTMEAVRPQIHELITARAGEDVCQQVGSLIWKRDGQHDEPKAWQSAWHHLRERDRSQSWAAIWEQVWSPLDDLVTARVWNDIPMGESWSRFPTVNSTTWTAIWQKTWNPLERQIRAGITYQLQDHTWTGAWRQVADQIGLEVWKASLGQQRAADHAFHDALAEYGVHPSPMIEALSLVARSCGWWWPFRGITICTERPTRLARDEQGRLHCTHGKALEYPGGWGLWRIHGVRVDERMVLHPETYTAEEVMQESNTERRRIILERFGFERFIRESGAQPLDNDEYGTLYHVRMPGDEPLAMVHVVNSTPEPDGSYREFFIHVPPNIRRARTAVAWTFGLNSDEYDPGPVLSSNQ